MGRVQNGYYKLIRTLRKNHIPSESTQRASIERGKMKERRPDHMKDEVERSISDGKVQIIDKKESEPIRTDVDAPIEGRSRVETEK